MEPGTGYLLFVSSNPKFLKVFPKIFPTKIKPTKYAAKENKEARKAKEEGRRELAKFCFLRMPELSELIFCVWIRRPLSLRPVTLLNNCGLMESLLARIPFSFEHLARPLPGRLR